MRTTKYHSTKIQSTSALLTVVGSFGRSLDMDNPLAYIASTIMNQASNLSPGPKITDAEFQRRLENSTSALMAWFDYNRDNQNGWQRRLLYTEFPEHFTFSKSTKRWSPRRKLQIIGRMYVSYPGQGARYYIRLLLCHQRGCTTWEDLHRVRGIVCAAWQEAAERLGLLNDGIHWEEMFLEVAPIRPGWVLRQLFVLALRQNVPNVNRLWHRFAHHICDDLLLRIQQRFPALQQEILHHPIEQDYGLYFIDSLLREQHHTLQDYPNLPAYVLQWNLLAPNPLLLKERDFDGDALLDEAARLSENLNNDQRAVHARVMDAVVSNQPRLFFFSG